MSKEERKRIKEAEEKAKKKEEGEILTRPKDTFGKYLMTEESQKPKVGRCFVSARSTRRVGVLFFITFVHPHLDKQPLQRPTHS